jgi:hypothetical protein
LANSKAEGTLESEWLAVVIARFLDQFRRELKVSEKALLRFSPSRKALLRLAPSRKALLLRLAPSRKALLLRLARSRSPKPPGFGAGEAKLQCDSIPKGVARLEALRWAW